MSIKSKEDLLNKQAEVNEQIKSYTCRVLVCSGTGCIASGAQKIYEEMSVLCERIDGVTVEMQKDVPHVGVIKTGCLAFSCASQSGWMLLPTVSDVP